MADHAADVPYTEDTGSLFTAGCHTQQCAQVGAERSAALPIHKLLCERGADMSPHSFQVAVDRLCLPPPPLPPPPSVLLLPLLQCYSVQEAPRMQ